MAQTTKKMRITSGSAKNITLTAPDIPNFRAAQDIVKQAVFAIIGNKVVGAVCLDLFAGSGSFGLEALSRGAANCDFVDENGDCRDMILQNIAKCSFEGKSRAFLKSASKFVEKMANTKNTKSEEKIFYDLVFMDPFYNDLNHRHLIKNLDAILKPDGLVVFTHGDNLDLNSQIENTDFKLVTERRFGATVISILNLQL